VGFAVHESATISTVWPVSPCFQKKTSSYFDPLKPLERVDNHRPRVGRALVLADNYRNLFLLRVGVKWQRRPALHSKA